MGTDNRDSASAALQFVKPSDFNGKKKLSGRILNAFTSIPYQIYKDNADDEQWVSIPLLPYITS